MGESLMVADGTSRRTRTSNGEPVRLKVGYRCAEALVHEYSKCVARRGSVIVSKQAVALGTRFVFEMCIPEQIEPLEIHGRVTSVRPIDAHFEIVVEYSATDTQRDVLERLLARIQIDPTYATVRRHPRIPVNLIARGTNGTNDVIVRDLSRGGMQLECTPPSYVAVGTRLTLTAELNRIPLALSGSVVWLREIGAGAQRIGVQLDRLDDIQLMVVDGMTRLLRPQRLELAFDEPVVSARGSRDQLSLGDPLAARLIENAAVEYLSRLGGLGRANSESDVGAECARARVALTGDVSGELALEVSLPLCKQLARATLGDSIVEFDDDLVVDTLAEVVSIVAGFACDRFESHDLDVEVSPPLPGDLQTRPSDAVRVVAFQSALGVAKLTIVTRVS